MESAAAPERLQKILARCSSISRRQAEELISAGEVTVNGAMATLGLKATWGKDAIKLRGKLLTQTADLVTIAFYKPRNVISMMSDPQKRPTLADYLAPLGIKLFPIGRLDFNTEGLLLLTNDGALAEKLHKRLDIPKTYQIKVKGHPNQEMLSRIAAGIRLDPRSRRLTRPHSVSVHHQLAQKAFIKVVTLHSNSFDLRDLCETRGFLVEKIVRHQIGHIHLGTMKPGEYIHLSNAQIQTLLEQPELGLKEVEKSIHPKAIRAVNSRAQPKVQPKGQSAVRRVTPLPHPAKLTTPRIISARGLTPRIIGRNTGTRKTFSPNDRRGMGPAHQKSDSRQTPYRSPGRSTARIIPRPDRQSSVGSKRPLVITPLEKPLRRGHEERSPESTQVVVRPRRG